MFTKIRIFIIRQLVKLVYRIKYRIRIRYNDFDPKRTDAYFMVGNHSFLHDGLIHEFNLKRYPYPIINSMLFTNPKMKYLLTKVIYSIPKRKGQIDISTLREMLRVLKSGRGIMVFPEGNSSFFGKESEIPFSTVKMFKRFKVDVVVVKTNGAYLSNPRWGLHSTFRGLIEIEYKTLFKASELPALSEEEIYEKLVSALRFNDWEWNRKIKHLYHPKKRAEGLEAYIYYCPNCHRHQTLYTKGNHVYCEHCGEIAHFNAYSLLSGLPFDDLIEWDRLQKQALPEIIKQLIVSEGSMKKVDMKTFETVDLGAIDVEVNIKSRAFYIQNRDEEKVFEIDEIEGLTLTRRNELSFDYRRSTYLIKLKDPMLVYDAINYIKGA